MAEARKRLGRSATIVGTLILAGLLYGAPVAAAQDPTASGANPAGPAGSGINGVEWTDSARSLKGMTVRPLGVEWTE